MRYETPIRTRGSHELEERDPTRMGYSDLNRGEEHDPKQRERGPRYDPNRGNLETRPDPPGVMAMRPDPVKKEHSDPNRTDED